MHFSGRESQGVISMQKEQKRDLDREEAEIMQALIEILKRIAELERAKKFDSSMCN